MASPAIGSPRLFGAGTFAGRMVRAEVKEIQHATGGRKFYTQDRRPIDPPPVAELFLYEILNAGTSIEMETPIAVTGAEPVLLPGFICQVELFPANGTRILQAVRRPPDGLPYAWGRPRPGDNRDIVAYIEGYPITESSGISQQLAGERFSALNQIQARLLFAFGDLSCAQEGCFVLRYRVFDLYSMRPGEPTPILAECYGHPFRIYEPREFPGLGASTNLTRLLHQRGVRVSIRQEAPSSSARRRRRADNEIAADE